MGLQREPLSFGGDGGEKQLHAHIGARGLLGRTRVERKAQPSVGVLPRRDCGEKTGTENRLRFLPEPILPVSGERINRFQSEKQGMILS